MKTELSKQQDDIIFKNKQPQLSGRQILTSLNSKEEHKHNKQPISIKETSINKKELQALITIKENEISSLSHTQEKYQCELQALLFKLNDIIIEATNQKNNNNINPKQLEYFEQIRAMRIKDFQKAKSQNKIYKDQYDLYQSKANGISSDKLNELESKIDSLVEDNQSLTKKIRELKNKQNVKSKVLEGYSSNVKYPREIKAYTEEIKSLSSKKHDYYVKLNTNRKAISNCLFQMTKIEELYSKLKSMTNLPNLIPVGKIDYEINRLNTDLKGNEDDIIQRIDNDEMIIIQEDIKKQLNAYNNNSVLPHPRYLKALPLKNMKKNPHTSHSANRRIIIQNQDKRLSPQSLKPIVPSTSNKRGIYSNLNSNNNCNNDIGDIEDKDISNITYENLTDYEYRELITKKEHYNDIILRLENSIKEAKKMYERKLKEMNNTLSQSSKKLSYVEQENELLKSEISDLSKISKLNEEANQMKKESQKVFKNIHKEPVIQTINNNNDASETRNDILNDLNVLDNYNERNHNNKYSAGILEVNDELEDRGEGSKIKFPDISNVENIDEDKSTINREKVLIDIKKRYIKVQPKQEYEEVDYDKENEDGEKEKDANDNDNEENINEIDLKSHNNINDIQNKEKNSISIEAHSINDTKIEDVKENVIENNNEDKQKEEEKVGNHVNNDKLSNQDNNNKEKDQSMNLEEFNANNNNDIIENNLKQYPPKTIIRIGQREGKTTDVFDNNSSPIIDKHAQNQQKDETKQNIIKEYSVNKEVLMKDSNGSNLEKENETNNDNDIEKIVNKQEMEIGKEKENKVYIYLNAQENEQIKLKEKQTEIGQSDYDNKKGGNLKDSIDNEEKEIQDKETNKIEERKEKEEQMMEDQEKQIDDLKFDDENDGDGNEKDNNQDHEEENNQQQGEEEEKEEEEEEENEEEENEEEENEEEENEDQEEEMQQNNNEDIKHEENEDQEEEMKQNNNEDIKPEDNDKQSNEENEFKENIKEKPLSDSLENSPQKEHKTIISKLRIEEVYQK